MKQHPDAILIIAPRHPERIDKIANYCKSKSLNYVKRTKQKVFTDQHQVYLLDTLGELQLHYAASQLAFVGGSLVETGGQNMMEPASLGLPVISGPHTFNFTEITELLLKEDVLIRISNESELTNEVSKLLNDANRRHHIGENGRKVIESNKGNIDRLMQLIEPCLSL
jgi:3-deoxy-D-manno-octulosonic-acid transferase